MKVEVQGRHLRLDPTLRSLIGKQSAKVRRLLPSFKPHDLDLHVVVEMLPRGRQCETVLVLMVPQTAIRVRETATNPSTSITHAFHELLRRVQNSRASWRARNLRRPPHRLEPFVRSRYGLRT